MEFFPRARRRPAASRSAQRRLPLQGELLESRSMLALALEGFNLNSTGAIGSDPGEMVVSPAGDQAYFSATSAFSRGLWRTDGTGGETRLLRDGIGADPHWLTVTGDSLYFVAPLDPQRVQREVWVSDGTADGTHVVKAINGTELGNLVDVNGRLFFTVDDGMHGRELWTSDGTEGGTKLVRDILPGAAGSQPSGLVAVGNELLFFASSELFAPVTLWRSDGTENGTTLVHSLTNSRLIGDWHVTSDGSAIYFADGNEVWSSDGTADGTIRLADATVLGIAPAPDTFGAIVNRMTKVNGSIYFQTNRFSVSAGPESAVWTTDGSPEGTRRVTTLAGELGPFTATMDGTLFFAVTTSSSASLWRSSGTPGTSQPIRSWAAGGLQRTASMRAIGEMVYFSADDSTNGFELWQTDGTETGTQIVHDIAVGPTGSSPVVLGSLDGILLFKANDQLSGLELWRSDGSAAGTQLVKDIDQRTLPSFPRRLTPATDQMFFVADDGIHGNELWKTDSTQSGTMLVKDIVEGGDGTNLTHLTTRGNSVFFVKDDFVEQSLWVSDGTPSGTIRLHDPSLDVVPWSPQDLAVSHTQGRLYFTAEDAAHGRELWTSDGTPEGTHLVVDLNPGPASSSPSRLSDKSYGMLFVTQDDNGGGDDLWYTDGTVEGTQRIHETTASITAVVPRGRESSLLENYFVVDSGDEGVALWRQRGLGAELIQSFPAPQAGQSGIANMTGSAQDLYFTYQSSPLSIELWRVEPYKVPTIIHTFESSDPAKLPWVGNLTDVAGSLFLFADGLDVNNGLWRVPHWGLEAIPIRPSRTPLSAIRTIGPEVAAVGDVLYFRAYDGITGVLWRTDGTDEGTGPIGEFTPFRIEIPYSLASFHNELYFVWRGTLVDDELWKLSDCGPGDFDCDGYVSARDIDRLSRAIRNNESDPRFELNGDQVIDLADHAYLITDILKTFPGDHNLDGLVRLDDYIVPFVQYASLFRQSSELKWGDGDFNGDALVDVRDFNLWYSNRYREPLTAGKSDAGKSGRIPRAPLPSLSVSPVPVALPVPGAAARGPRRLSQYQLNDSFQFTASIRRGEEAITSRYAQVDSPHVRRTTHATLMCHHLTTEPTAYDNTPAAISARDLIFAVDGLHDRAHPNLPILRERRCATK